MQFPILPRFLLIFAAILCFGIGNVSAQKAMVSAPVSPPQSDLFEVSLGFDYLRAEDALAKNMYGGDVSLFLNINSWLAVGGQFIGEYGEENHLIFRQNTTFDENRLFYVGGLRVNFWNRNHWKVFCEVMGGGAHGHVSALVFGNDRSASADGFAAVVGAGAEWKFSPRWAWRVVEADYIPAHLGGEWENNLRVSTGLSFSFGSGW